MQPKSVTVRVPAKINLQRGVGPLRADGYHELVTVFHAINICDDVIAEATAPGAGISLEMVGEASVAADATNLAWRAAQALADARGVDPDVHLQIHKRIPVAGGMAGGSADAAATLVACDALWRLSTERAELARLAATLGSDVSFALHGGTAIGTGRGEQLTDVLARGTLHWVVAIADEGLSTPAVYAECDRLRAGEQVSDPVVSEVLMQGLRSTDAQAVGKALTNDLQPAALSLRPELGQVLKAGDDLGALGGIVSGSGPTLVFIVADEERALDLAVGLMSTGLVRSVKRAHGPVPGARVVNEGW
ncbi:MAG: 4-(cytidine 5'-diphospho)-2-C-methyl-D-erythritol kinase [Actinomycetales bacterium]